MNDQQPEDLARVLERLSTVEPWPDAVDRAMQRARRALGDVAAGSRLASPGATRRIARRPSRWAVAAVIVILVALAVGGPLTLSNLGTRSAFARVQDALRNVPSMSYRVEMRETAQGAGVKASRTVVDFGRNRVRQEMADGEQVMVMDMKSGTLLQLFPRLKAAIVTTGMSSPKDDPPTDVAGFFRKLRNADPKTVQHLPDRELDGRQVNVFRIPPESPLAHGTESLYFVDPGSHLPVRSESVVRHKDGRTAVRLVCSEFSFGECDASLFDLSPPGGYTVEKFEVGAARPEPVPVAVAPQPGGNAPIAFEMRLADDAPGDGLTEAAVDRSNQKVYLHAAPIITRQDVQGARLLKDPSSGHMIELTFTEKAAARLAEATSGNQKRLLAVLIDGRVVFAPRIFARISSPALISGSFTAAEAADIVRGLNGPAR